MSPARVHRSTRQGPLQARQLLLFFPTSTSPPCSRRRTALALAQGPPQHKCIQLFAFKPSPADAATTPNVVEIRGAGYVSLCESYELQALAERSQPLTKSTRGAKLYTGCIQWTTRG